MEGVLEDPKSCCPVMGDTLGLIRKLGRLPLVPRRGQKTQNPLNQFVLFSCLSTFGRVPMKVRQSQLC